MVKFVKDPTNFPCSQLRLSSTVDSVSECTVHEVAVAGCQNLPFFSS